MTEYDLTLMSEECQNWEMGYMSLKYLPLGWCGQNMKAVSYMLNPLGWCERNMKAIPYKLQQSCTFQNLNTAVNDKVWLDHDLGKRSNWGRGCTIERSYPKVDVSQILKRYLEYFSSYEHFSKLKHGFKWQSMTWPWPRQKVKLRKGCTILKGLTLMLV